MSSRRRIKRDVMQLKCANHETTCADGFRQLYVKFNGPAGTTYFGGIWSVSVHLPKGYPFKSPSIRFMNPIYHPNICGKSGSVCLNVINQTWSPMYTLTQVFDIFLPQLLKDPNPEDPLNRQAAQLYFENPAKYELVVGQWKNRFSLKPNLPLDPVTGLCVEEQHAPSPPPLSPSPLDLNSPISISRPTSTVSPLSSSMTSSMASSPILGGIPPTPVRRGSDVEQVHSEICNVDEVSPLTELFRNVSFNDSSPMRSCSFRGGKNNSQSRVPRSAARPINMVRNKVNEERKISDIAMSTVSSAQPQDISAVDSCSDTSSEGSFFLDMVTADMEL